MKQLTRKLHILLDLPETRFYLLALLDNSGQRPEIVLRTRSYNTIRTALANGLGASILNIRPAQSGRDAEEFVCVPISYKLRDPTLVVADPYGNHKPAYIRSFIKVLYQYFVGFSHENFAVVRSEDTQDLLYFEPDV